MNTNLVADEVNTYLLTKHARVYRNRTPQNPTFPYVVFRVDTVTNTYPSEDFYVNIDVYEKADATVINMENIADSIDNGLNMTVIKTNLLNLYFDREQRQYVQASELVTAQSVNMRYVVRAYFI